ncbi:hypothetical protein, partial [Frankia sp. Cr1]|uniref:hypothetical protein n=1 Tax=Frankia sp. Cr1 TaxID=3073931 RepID=UPI002AD1E5D5
RIPDHFLLQRQHVRGTSSTGDSAVRACLMDIVGDDDKAAGRLLGIDPRDRRSIRQTLVEVI